MKKLFKTIWFKVSVFFAVMWKLKWYILFGLFILFLVFCVFLILNELFNSTLGNPEAMGRWFGRIINGFNQTK